MSAIYFHSRRQTCKRDVIQAAECMSLNRMTPDVHISSIERKNLGKNKNLKVYFINDMEHPYVCAYYQKLWALYNFFSALHVILFKTIKVSD